MDTRQYYLIIKSLEDDFIETLGPYPFKYYAKQKLLKMGLQTNKYTWEIVERNR